MLTFVGYVILVGSMDLDTRILGVNLPFNKTLENLRRPHIEAYSTFDTGDFKTEMFLNTVI